MFIIFLIITNKQVHLATVINPYSKPNYTNYSKSLAVALFACEDSKGLLSRKIGCSANDKLGLGYDMGKMRHGPETPNSWLSIPHYLTTSCVMFCSKLVPNTEQNCNEKPYVNDCFSSFGPIFIFLTGMLSINSQSFLNRAAVHTSWYGCLVLVSRREFG